MIKYLDLKDITAQHADEIQQAVAGVVDGGLNGLKTTMPDISAPVTP